MTDEGDNVAPAARRLSSLIARIERLSEEKKALTTAIREVYIEAKSAGFDAKVIREVVKRRGKDKAEIEEFDAVLETYETNLDSIMD